MKNPLPLLIAGIAITITLSGCGNEPKVEDPIHYAKLNFFGQFVIKGENLLADSFCSAKIEKTGTPDEYIECSAKLKGFTYYDRYYCNTKKPTAGGSCSTSKPS